MSNSLRDFKLGFLFIFDGTRLLFSMKGALKWAVFPFLINIGLIVGSLSYIFSDITQLASTVVGFILPGTTSGWFYDLLLGAVKFGGGAILTIVVFYVGFLLSTVIASPFNSILAEKTLSHLKSDGIKPLGVADWLRITIKQLTVSILRALLFALIGLFIFVFSFVPVLNLLGAFFALLIVAFDCTDYAMEIKLMTLRQRLNFFRKYFSAFSGMACVLGLTLMVPGLTLLLLPCAVVGAAQTLALLNNRNSI